LLIFNTSGNLYFILKIMGYLLSFLVLTAKLFNHFKKINMKNYFKVGVVALAIAFSFAACKGKSGSGSSDSDTTKKADTSMAKMADTTAKKDTAVKADTSKMKPMAKDTTKKK
jgi:hypothetical protein